MHIANRPPVHLWIYNHPFTGISDQIEFFVATLRQHGYPVSVGRSPSDTSLNVVIENFNAGSAEILTDYCRRLKKKVAVIMTEHLDFENDQIYIHGAPLWSKNDYMHPATQAGRIRFLMDCLPYIRSFLVLGDLPELRNMSTMLPGVSVYTVPFPTLEFVTDANVEYSVPITSDALFTGFITEYRTAVLTSLKQKGLVVDYPQQLVSRKKRDLLTYSTKIVLNIPQRDGWSWLSLMRIFAALKCGRSTISLDTHDDSEISSCCLQLDTKKSDWLGTLVARIKDWRGNYAESYKNYMQMCGDFEGIKKFPYDLFAYWAITDRINHR